MTEEPRWLTADARAELVSDLLKRAQSCEALAMTARGDVALARLGAKASAYRHAAKLVEDARG